MFYRISRPFYTTEKSTSDSVVCKLTFAPRGGLGYEPIAS